MVTALHIGGGGKQRSEISGLDSAAQIAQQMAGLEE